MAVNWCTDAAVTSMQAVTAGCNAACGATVLRIWWVYTIYHCNAMVCLKWLYVHHHRIETKIGLWKDLYSRSICAGTATVQYTIFLCKTCVSVTSVGHSKHTTLDVLIHWTCMGDVTLSCVYIHVCCSCIGNRIGSGVMLWFRVVLWYEAAQPAGNKPHENMERAACSVCPEHLGSCLGHLAMQYITNFWHLAVW